MAKISAGTLLPPLAFRTLAGEDISIPSRGPELLHLQFRRFAGCPICSTHLRGFTRRAEEIRAAGIREVIFFHSSEKELRKHQADLPFDVVADPRKEFYRRFGVESSFLGVLHPRSLLATLRGTLRGDVGLNMENGPFGMPADFLLAPSGEAIAVKYGAHAYDQWEVEELLWIARQARASS